MRPLELTVTGLRSYRTTTTVTFPDDWQLAAVVGLTGAGKSSLLEAIVYALFGSGTVPGASQPINLITDDAREMRVVFRFAVGPERFEIARTYRRVGNVQPVLKTAARTYTRGQGGRGRRDAAPRAPPGGLLLHGPAPAGAVRDVAAGRRPASRRRHSTPSSGSAR